MKSKQQPHPKLEQLVETVNYGDLPETWEVSNIERFSARKTLYGYQTDALRKAARTLHRYYREKNPWRKNEPLAAEDARKRDFAGLYTQGGRALLNEFSIGERKKELLRILSEFIDPEGGVIPYHHFVNRMCFWMATGSGKTLVMVKLIEYLHSLKRRGEIPPHDILLLAPGEQLLRQIKWTVEEFNSDPANKLKIHLTHLRDAGRQVQATIDDSTVVYYHESHNISGEQKEVRIDYQRYQRGGQWYVILDEAHKGAKNVSKRQAYYALMARRGFLFNFSATFTDAEDIFTTVKKYNLEDFVRNGYGKNIYLNKTEYSAFKNQGQEINPAERSRIVLKSLITLAYLSMRVREVRAAAGSDKIYHLPLMVTLTGSVNYQKTGKKNDLWNFFEVLRQIATDQVDQSIFDRAKEELIDEWSKAKFLFDSAGGEILGGGGRRAVKSMTVAKMREVVFLSRKTGALEYIHNPKNKDELAFKSKATDKPFALIRIGDTSQWKKNLLRGYDETESIQEKSFFEKLDQNQITILMGSRKFTEGWDTNRPNVINFINIGSREAKKYVMQSIGRGVRIEPISDRRRRLSHINLQDAKTKFMSPLEDKVAAIETLFLFATYRADIESVLDGIKEAGESDFIPLPGFDTAARPVGDGGQLPLLVPEYKEVVDDSVRPPFVMSASAQKRFKEWVKATSDSVFVVRDGLGAGEIRALRDTVKNGKKIRESDEKVHAEHDLADLQDRVVSHNAQKTKISESVKALDEENDIVHFRNIRVRGQHAEALGKVVEGVKEQAAKHEKVLAKLPAEDRGDYERFKIEETYQGAAGQGMVRFARIVGHYYLPMILWENEKPDYMQHIISAESEIRFVNQLDRWIGKNPQEAGKWTWMFSKIDESIDQVHIPYYDNTPRKFFPDFVFWLWRGNEYRIVFVDPKTPTYAAAYQKIIGYKRLFEAKENPRVFRHQKKQVRVELLMYKPPDAPPVLTGYEQYWIDNPARIFAG